MNTCRHCQGELLKWSLFAGTAGVWRIAAINEAGGWKDRTTVEDMDLAVRASLKGWKFIFLNDLGVSINYDNYAKSEQINDEAEQLLVYLLQTCILIFKRLKRFSS